MKKSQGKWWKSNKKTFWAINASTLIVAAAVFGLYWFYGELSPKTKTKLRSRDENNNNSGSLNNSASSPSQTTNANGELKLTSWNIANFGKSSNKLGFRVQAVAELIVKEKVNFLSIQEVGYEDWAGVERVIEVLKEKFNKTFKLAKSPAGLYSTERPNSKESYAILYNPDLYEPLDTKGHNAFYGKEVKFTRPLWYSYWSVKNTNTKFWIINGHLDAPGKSTAKGVQEELSPTIKGLKWTGQGSQEVNEFLDIHNAFESLKKYYQSQTLEDLVIFNGDTNIKKENTVISNNYYVNLGYKTGYINNSGSFEWQNSSMSEKAYANPYDKFIAYDPKNEFKQASEQEFKYNLLKAFQSHLERQKYLELYKTDRNLSSTQGITDGQMAFRISDHTFVHSYIKLNKTS
ncbi:MnuA family membrane nuclease [Mycoplasmopsis bovirhinis]|uniref:MnuA family membrane nuclease n=1 Tax=Mycoplasmopsis bovirhinis TaxID=29553 RepID=UPI000E73987B|nr:nuclease [Mycoplasmopsis bovirhinis]